MSDTKLQQEMSVTTRTHISLNLIALKDNYRTGTIVGRKP